MMDDFTSLLAAIRQVFPASRLEPLNDAQLAEIRGKYPGVPEHYLAFLSRVGWGSLGDGNFMVYSGPCEAKDFFDQETAAGLDGILFFGDNLGGWIVGFDTRNDWRIVGVDSTSPEPYPDEAQTVGEFIQRRVAGREAV